LKILKSRGVKAAVIGKVVKGNAITVHFEASKIRLK